MMRSLNLWLSVFMSLGLLLCGGAAHAGEPESKPTRSTSAAKDLSKAAKDLSKAAKDLSKAAKTNTKKKASAESLIDQLSPRTPWNGLYLDIREKEKKAKLRLSTFLGSSLTALLEVDAPLDAETRQAPLAGGADKAPSLGFKFSLEWNRQNAVLRDLMAKMDQLPIKIDCEEYKDATGATGCGAGDKDFLKWKKEEWKKEEKRKRNVKEATNQVEKAYPSIRAPDDPLSRSQAGFVSWAIGGEFSAKLDRFSVYDKADVSAEPGDRSNAKVMAGFVGRFYPASWIATRARAGYSYKNGLKVGSFKRCETLGSTVEGVSGQACSDAKHVTSDPGHKHGGYFEAGATFVAPFLNWGTTVPGVDVALSYEGYSKSPARTYKVVTTAFVTPTDSPVVSRFGLGIEYAYSRDDDDQATRELTPFLLVGASL